MKMRSKFLAIFGATVLTVGVVGIAFAEDLKDNHTGVSIGWDENGDPEITGTEDDLLSDECGELDPGEILIHFVLSPTDADAGNLTVDFDPDPDYGPAAADGNQGSQLDWDVSVTGPVTIVDATTDVDGQNAEQDELKISHICVGEEVEESEPPSFEASEEPFTEPPSDTFGAKDSSGPADGAWLLVVALGVLLASIVVLTPARAKSRR